MQSGDEYNGPYPITDDRLVFEAQAIDVGSFVGLFFRMTDLNNALSLIGLTR